MNPLLFMFYTIPFISIDNLFRLVKFIPKCILNLCALVH